MNFMAKYKDWLLSDYFDEETKAELESIEEDEEEIEDRFYKDLDFGTGGLRGKIGAGTNRMNKYTVRKATQGLANYIINYKEDGCEQGVVISYDSRHKSPEFAREVALVLNGNGIETYLFDELRPVPVLSFAVRELNTVAGVMITASHNPAEYNGYKVYSKDGGQVVPEKARKITAEIDEIDDYSLVKRIEKDEAEKQDLFHIIGEEIDDKYINNVKKEVPEKELCKEKGKDFSLIYTPLHGTGNKPVSRILTELGFEQLDIVEEQAEPDPDFSTVEVPNPEEVSSFELALEKARNKQEAEMPELIMGTDPDGDRMGLIVKNDEGEYIDLNGNQIGILILNYILERGELPDNGVVIKTVVTTEMTRKIAADYDIEVQDVLTGFKYIGEKIKDFKEKGDKNFIFGFEESYGFLAGTYTRDKDAVAASAIAASMALYYNEEEGISLYEKLHKLYKKYGYFLEDLESIRMEGKEGQEKIKNFLEGLREDELHDLAGQNIVCYKDYLKGISYNYQDDTEEEINLPESQVIQYLLEDESLITIRPSGTEPKLKIYFAVSEENIDKAEKKLKDIKSKVMSFIEEKL